VSARTTYFVILLGAAAWCAAVLVAPVLVSAGGSLTYFGRIIYQFFHPVCHQLSERSLHILGEPLAVCTRCTSVYVAFLAGTLLYPALRTVQMPQYPPRSVLLAAAIPMVIDAIGGIVGIHAVTQVSRLLSGAAFGLVAPFFVIPAAIESLHHLFARVVSTPVTESQKGQPNA